MAENHSRPDGLWLPPSARQEFGPQIEPGPQTGFELLEASLAMALSPIDTPPRLAYTPFESEEDELVFFDSLVEKQNIYGFSKMLAEYAREEAVKDIIFIDKAARLMRVGVAEYWKLAYIGEQKPESHFLSPSVTRGPEVIRPIFRGMARKRAYKEVEKQLLASNSSLPNHRDDPVMIVDSCTHTGRTIAELKSALEDCGFKDLRLAVLVNDLGDDSGIKLDLSMRSGTEHGAMCNPFMRDNATRKAGNNIYVSSNRDPWEHMRSKALRLEIRRIVREGMIKGGFTA
jgi:hypothetical protein